MASRVLKTLGLDVLIPRNRDEGAIALASFINTFGSGLFMTVEALYFTRFVGLSATQLGLGLSIAAACGLVAGFAIGRIADLREPRALTSLLMIMTAVSQGLVVFANSFWTFTIITSFAMIFDRASNTTRAVVISRIAGPEGRVRLRAYIRSVVNLGIALGTTIAGFALIVDSSSVYRGLLVADALTTLIAALAINRLPTFAPLPAAREHRATTAIRDRAYMTLTVLNAVSSIHYHVLSLAVPLWIANHTKAPIWVVAAAMLLNTIACVLFQVRMSAGAETPRGASQVARQGGLYLALGMFTYAAASLTNNGWVAAVVILVASAIHVTGELRQAAAAFGIAYGMSPEALQGQYQAVWTLGVGLGNLIAPVFITVLCLQWGLPGWVLLGCVFFVSGWLIQPIAKRAASNFGISYG